MKTPSNKGIAMTLYVLFYLLTGTYAQENYMPELIPPSPTAAALGKYGEIPVSQYTGIPSINIPLWDISVRDITLPVSLSYHAGGIKVEEIAPWTGLGWSLNAGGVITRTVRGLPDELPNGYLNNVVPAVGNIDEQADYNYLYAVSEGSIDASPDIYYYSFAGYSGKFVFEENGDIFSIPHNQLKIEKISAFQFEITDENGIRYVFGKSFTGEDAYEVSSASGHNNLNAPFVSSWFLTHVVSPSGYEVVNLKYTTAGGHISQTLSAETEYQPIPGNLLCMAAPSPVFSNIATVMDKAVKLSEINWPGGKMVFLKNGTRNDLGTANLDYKLTDIVLYGADDQEFRRFSFNYSYFNNSASDFRKKDSNSSALQKKRPEALPIHPTFLLTKKA
ncbi:MAG: hypothetical protein R3C61_00845 [Bacteroidia bacterium]